MYMPELTNVHQAMNEAAQQPEAKEGVAICTFKLQPQLKEKVEAICRANSTTVSAWLRQCCEGLVADYNG